MKPLLFLLLSFLTLHVFAGGKNTNGNGTAIVTGSVVDAATKKPLEAVQVTVLNTINKTEQKVFTDKQGKFKITQLQAGNVSLRFYKNEYIIFEKGNITLTPDGQHSVNVQLNAEPEEDTFNPKTSWEKFQII